MNRVAVYGTLRQGFGNHRLLETSLHAGDATVTGRMHSLGPYPAVCIQEKGRVVVELYDVTDDVLERLDRLEGHPTFYQRVDVQTTQGPAQMYVMSESELLDYPVVTSGDWADRHDQHMLDEAA